MLVYIFFFTLSNFLRFVQCDRWPSTDELALRIQTKLISKNGLDDDFFVDFYAVNDFLKIENDKGVVAIKYQLPDGMHVAEVYDWTNNIRMTKLILLGEISDGQPPFRQFCFVDKLGVTDLLPSDSVLRLRQKNSMAIRLAEEDRGKETNSYSLFIPSRRIPSAWSFVGSRLCNGVDGFYLTDDVYKTANLNESSLFIRRSDMSTLPLCNTEAELATPSCKCSIKYCLPWYPCGWKYCDENHSTSTANTSSSTAFRCGVRSCRIRRLLHFSISITNNQKSPSCEFDEDADPC